MTLMQVTKTQSYAKGLNKRGPEKYSEAKRGLESIVSYSDSVREKDAEKSNDTVKVELRMC